MTRPQPRYKKGDKIGGQYQVHQVKMGGMGEVYLCLDLEQMYPYALKTFQQRYQSQALKKAFEQEVATWIALEKHPNIVRCFYMDILDNQPFMVLEWIAGEEGKGADLRGWLRRGPLDLKLALEITIDICQGLIHVQEKQPGLVHRDLKPENILVAQGPLAKITDFGLAQIVEQAELELNEVESEVKGRHSLVRQGRIAGTPAYMAPEQWGGENLDVRTDIYAVGCILYEMLTSGRPLPTEATQTTQPHPLSKRLPADLSNLVNICLAKSRIDRPDSLPELLAQLEALYQQLFTIPPRAPSIVEKMTVFDYNNRGYTYDLLQRYELAMADYNQAIEYDPSSAIPYTNRGNIYAKTYRYDEALADHTYAIELSKSDPLFYLNRGRTFFSTRRYEEALADYSRALELDFTNPKTYYNRGATYGELHRYNEALTDYSYAIQLDPTFVSAFHNRGNIYAALQRYEEALQDLTHTIDLDTSLASAYLNRGSVYSTLLDYENALNDFNQAIKLDPTLPLAYLNIGLVWQTVGVMPTALVHFEKAAELGHSEAAKFAAEIKQMLGRDPDAKVDLLDLAFEAFQYASSPSEMWQTVAQYPFMVAPEFTIIVESFMEHRVSLEDKPDFQQRLFWLQQIIEEKHKWEQNQ